MNVSPGSIEDVSRVAALYRATFDDRLSTVTGIRHRQTSARPDDALRFWRAEEDGELIGWAFAGLDSFASLRTTANASIVVHPAHRRAGAGSALWDEASAHLDAIAARRIVAYSRADDDSVAFVGGRGFTLESTDTTSAVDPRTLPEPPEPPSGVIIAPMAAHAADPTPVFEADKESALDEPGPSDFSGVTYESWRRLIWNYPDCDHELSVVAEADGTVVGTSFLYSDRQNGRAMNAGTGVVRSCRGRGLGLLMKRHSLALAAAAGITQVITQNDATNAPMLAINAALGYQPLSSGHAWVLER
jgi:L-amino acid N-acyltransferase YncA/RimJ/RimL family protein N-acetyltransferase